jgi:hypothetical protein
MSYSASGGFGDMIVRWSNNISSSMFIAKGPTCGSQRAAQRMLQDLGYGAGRSDIEDPNFVSDMEKFANDRNIRHTVGTVDQAMCHILSQEWMLMARLDPKAAPYLVYERDPAKPKPAPMVVDYEAENRPPVIMPPGSIIPIDQLPPALRPQSSTAPPPPLPPAPTVVTMPSAPTPSVAPQVSAPTPSPAVVPQVVTMTTVPQVSQPQVTPVYASAPLPARAVEVPVMQAMSPALAVPAWKRPAVVAGGATVGLAVGRAIGGGSAVGSIVGMLAGGAAGWFLGARV